jgi:hypothetical protein
MAGLQPPKDVMSLGVEGLIVAVDVAALHLSCSTKDQKNTESIAAMMEQRVNKKSCMIIWARKKEASVTLDTLISRIWVSEAKIMHNKFVHTNCSQTKP